MTKHVPLNISEDNDLRSQYVWHLIYKSKNLPLKISRAEIPRTLVQFWNNIQEIPADVQECIDTWKPLEEQGFERLLFDDDMARDFIASNFSTRYLNAFEECRHPAMRSDYFRLCYLYKKGGFYVDADDVYKNIYIDKWFQDERLKLQPLCYDKATDSMVDITDFLKKCEYSPTLIFYVNNDPIIAPPNHPLICMALERSTEVLLTTNKNIKDIQSITGPGNLTASLVRHAIEFKNAGINFDFILLDNWNNVSVPKWPLDYRKDKRNWRIWDGSDI
jgi:hypothetical protein